MSNRSKFWILAALVQEVRCPDQPISFHRKVIYTTFALFIFLAAGQLPLYGIHHQPPAIEPDPLHWLHLILASNHNTLLTHGIFAILAPEVLVKILVATKIIILDNNAPGTRILLNGAQKLLGILITILGAVNFYVRNQHFTVNMVLIMLQIICSGITVIYLDDVLKKGYGLLSGISLFTVTNVCGNILWKALSPMSIIYPEQCVEFEGAVVACVHLLMTRTDKLSAMSKAFHHQNLPNIISFLATCLFVPLAIFFQGFHIVLPVRHDIFFKLTATASSPISCMGLLSCTVYCFHFLMLSQSLADLHRDPFHAFIYTAFVLISCVFLSMWLIVCASSKGVFNGFVVLNEEQRLRAQPDSIRVNEIWSHVMKAACFGGFCAGALIIFADFIGVLGSGTGIMLALTALYPYVDGRASEVGSFGF